MGPGDYDQRTTKTDGCEAGAEGYGGDAKVASESGEGDKQMKEGQKMVGICNCNHLPVIAVDLLVGAHRSVLHRT